MLQRLTATEFGAAAPHPPRLQNASRPMAKLSDEVIGIIETTAERWRTRTFALETAQQHPSVLIFALLDERHVREAEVERLIRERARLVADRADLLAACQETFAHLTGWAARFEADGHLAAAD